MKHIILALLLSVCIAFGGSKTIATSQVVLSTTAASVAAANGSRRSVEIKNTDAAINVYVGIAGVTAANGHLIKPGETFKCTTSAQLFVVAASATPTVTVFQELD